MRTMYALSVASGLIRPALPSPGPSQLVQPIASPAVRARGACGRATIAGLPARPGAEPAVRGAPLAPGRLAAVRLPPLGPFPPGDRLGLFGGRVLSASSIWSSLIFSERRPNWTRRRTETMWSRRSFCAVSRSTSEPDCTVARLRETGMGIPRATQHIAFNGDYLRERTLSRIVRKGLLRTVTK
jgi:hypothetical protein